MEKLQQINKIMMLRNFLVKITFVLSVAVTAQNQPVKKYTLGECIKIALANNLSLKSAKNTEKSAKINYNQSKANLLPSLNGSYNLGINNGRSIDPFTNDFINNNTFVAGSWDGTANIWNISERKIIK